MPSHSDFPHLRLHSTVSLTPKYTGGGETDERVLRNKENRRAHARSLRSHIGAWKTSSEDARARFEEMGLEHIPQGASILIQIPEKSDAESLAHYLGMNAIAETESGWLLVAAEEVDFDDIEEKIRKFAADERGGGSMAEVLGIFESPLSRNRLELILDESLLAQWPLPDERTYVLDLGLHTAEGTRRVKVPSVRSKGVPAPQVAQRRQQMTNQAFEEARNRWLQMADERFGELECLVHAYEGEIISPPDLEHEENDLEHGVAFPDSIQVRVRMSGRGFKDVIQNLPFLFEMTLPEDTEAMNAENAQDIDSDVPAIDAPKRNSPLIGIIDSGIQEGHAWLAPAIQEGGKCFIPGKDDTDTADAVPGGHGTRVAGAVLYPNAIPTSGRHTPLARLVNLRVLDDTNRVPETLQPERYLDEIAEHSSENFPNLRIFNHSINATVPCRLKRMSAWAAKLDQLSHERDFLFIQSVGNLACTEINAREPHMNQLLEGRARIANPAQSLHSISVGSVSAGVWTHPANGTQTFAQAPHMPSAFSRAGFGMWDSVKPDVVEIGGDYLRETGPRPRAISTGGAHTRIHHVELLRSTLNGGPAFDRDAQGTSFSTPKVTHLAAKLAAQFPESPALLWRTLIVHGARWPQWAERHPNPDNVLRWIGYGMIDHSRSLHNSENRVTLFTPEAGVLRNRQAHVYRITIPESIREASMSNPIRVDVTMAYTAVPRRTRSSKSGYLETRLEWESSKPNESLVTFQNRITRDVRTATKTPFRWKLGQQSNHGDTDVAARTNGSIQKDWTEFPAHELPEEFAIAVRSKTGWNHRDDSASGNARYCLAVTFEVLDGSLPIYAAIRSVVEVRAEVRARA